MCAGLGLTVVMCVQVGTEKLIVNGRVRLILKPLLDELPIVGAIQVSFSLSWSVFAVQAC